MRLRAAPGQRGGLLNRKRERKRERERDREREREPERDAPLPVINGQFLGQEKKKEEKPTVL